MKQEILKKGKLLLASPSILNDKSFNRSAILLTEHDENGSIGFIVNRPLDYKLNDLVPETDCEFVIYQGGPVSPENLYFVHNVPDLIPKSIEIANNIYWGGDFETVSDLLRKNQISENNIRFFLGYSGWDVNQLDFELDNDKAWLVIDNNYKNILSTSESIWKNQIMLLGGKYSIWANAPKNPNLN